MDYHNRNKSHLFLRHNAAERGAFCAVKRSGRIICVSLQVQQCSGLKIAADLMRTGAGTAAAGRAEASGKADPPGMPDGTLKRSRAASATVSFLCLYHGYYRLDHCFVFQGQFFHFRPIHRNGEIEDNLPDPVAVRLLFREQFDPLNDARMNSFRSTSEAAS